MNAVHSNIERFHTSDIVNNNSAQGPLSDQPYQYNSTSFSWGKYSGTTMLRVHSTFSLAISTHGAMGIEVKE